MRIDPDHEMVIEFTDTKDEDMYVINPVVQYNIGDKLRVMDMTEEKEVVKEFEVTEVINEIRYNIIPEQKTIVRCKKC